MFTATMTTTPYQYCTKDECIERQELGQVSELESTVETCQLTQSKRIIDPTLAITKYRRSAATGGADETTPTRNSQTLLSTLTHLTKLCSTLRASSKHPPVEIDVAIGFTIDRLRACQSDATKLMGSSREGAMVPPIWHAQVIRLLIWIQYCSLYGTHSQNDTFLPRTIHTIKSTAYDTYWTTREILLLMNNDGEDIMDDFHSLDDEMLCYNAVGRICSISLLTATDGSLDTSWSGMLLEYTKRRRLCRPQKTETTQKSYPLWNICLDIASHINRYEYYYIWKKNSSTSKLPILAKCIIMSTSSLFACRYKQVQQYNISFGKSEQVDDMDRLLGIPHNAWTMQYALTFTIPTKYKEIEKWDDDDDEPAEIVMTLKEVSMPELEGNSIPKSSSSSSNSDDHHVNLVIRKGDEEWVFGHWYDPKTTTKWGISSEYISLMLQYGSPDKENISFSTTTAAEVCPKATTPSSDNNDNGVTATIPTPIRHQSSLSKALQASAPTSTSSLSGGSAIPKKNKIVRCKFYAQGSCRYGANCRFSHA
jgi:hypothetical protein